MNIKFSKKQSQVFNDANKRRIIICGRQSGKTYLLMNEIFYKLMTKKDYQIVYLAPTHSQAKKIFWNPFLERFDNRYFSEINKSDKYIKAITGSTLRVTSAQNVERERGLTINEFYIDEVQDVSSDVFGVLLPAIAVNDGSVTLAGTPKGYNWIVDYTNKRGWNFHTWTSIEGGFISPEFIEQQKNEMDVKTFQQEYLAEFVSGSGIIFYSFSDDNIVDVEFNPNTEAYLSFDFNVNPMTCVIVQENVVVKEFEVAYSNTFELCNIIMNYLKENKFNSTIYVTGDNTGNSRKSAASKTDYQIIEEAFKPFLTFGNWKRTRAVVNIEDRFNTTNSAFKSYSGEIKLKIDRKCHKLIKYLRLITRADYVHDTAGRTHLTDCCTYYAYNYLPIKRVEVAYF